MGRASAASAASATADFTEADVERRARRLTLVYRAHNDTIRHGNL